MTRESIAHAKSRRCRGEAPLEATAGFVIEAEFVDECGQITVGASPLRAFVRQGYAR